MFSYYLENALVSHAICCIPILILRFRSSTCDMHIRYLTGIP